MWSKSLSILLLLLFSRSVENFHLGTSKLFQSNLQAPSRHPKVLFNWSQIHPCKALHTPLEAVQGKVSRPRTQRQARGRFWDFNHQLFGHWTSRSTCSVTCFACFPCMPVSEFCLTPSVSVTGRIRYPTPPSRCFASGLPPAAQQTPRRRVFRLLSFL